LRKIKNSQNEVNPSLGKIRGPPCDFRIGKKYLLPHEPKMLLTQYAASRAGDHGI
jgi:hypothetical protein